MKSERICFEQKAEIWALNKQKVFEHARTFFEVIVNLKKVEIHGSFRMEFNHQKYQLYEISDLFSIKVSKIAQIRYPLRLNLMVRKSLNVYDIWQTLDGYRLNYTKKRMFYYNCFTKILHIGTVKSDTYYNTVSQSTLVNECLSFWLGGPKNLDPKLLKLRESPMGFNVKTFGEWALETLDNLEMKINFKIFFAHILL